MKSSLSMSMKTVLAAALLAAAASSHADDNDMAPGGDGYAYFHEDRPVVDKTVPTFGQTNPTGIPIATYEALSSPIAPEYQPAPVIDKTQPTFATTNPHGIPIATYEALSASNAPEYKAAPVLDYSTPSPFRWSKTPLQVGTSVATK